MTLIQRVAICFAAGVIGALAVVLLLFRHLRRRLALIPESRLGKAQLLYLVFLWWVVIGNLMRAIPPFQEQRLITEGVIHLVAVLCTLFALLWPRPLDLPDMDATIAGRMILTITLITIGIAQSKKNILDVVKHKRSFWYYLLALIIIIATVPWPFRTGIGRPWFPGMH